MVEAPAKRTASVHNTPAIVYRTGSLPILAAVNTMHMALIAIEGMQFYAHHGYYKEEQVLGGRYTVDVYLHTDVSAAAENDQLQHTINYEEVYQLALTEMAKHSKLIEHVCQRILQSVKQTYPGLQLLKVRVTKHNPPIKGQVERVFVEMEA